MESTDQKKKQLRKKKSKRAAERKVLKQAMMPHGTMKYLRIAPRKARMVADMIRGSEVDDAIASLTFSPRGAAKPILKLLESIVASAKKDTNLDSLIVKRIMIDEGPTLKRFLPRAMGRATRINKRTSHVNIVLGEKE